jgi:hypothetical protein
MLLATVDGNADNEVTDVFTIMMIINMTITMVKLAFCAIYKNAYLNSKKQIYKRFSLNN